MRCWVWLFPDRSVCVRLPSVVRRPGHLYLIYTFQHSSREEVTFGSDGELDMWAVPSCRHLTGWQVHVTANSRGSSKLALRQAPAECIHSHSSHVNRHQMDVKVGSEKAPRANTTHESTCERYYLFIYLYFDKSIGRAEPPGTHRSEMCSVVTCFA